MKKTIATKSRFQGFSWHFVGATLYMLFSISNADASIREQALAAVASLHKYQSTFPLSQELKNIETSFAHAEEFSGKSQPEIAERYYLLTVQKVRVFLSSIVQQLPAPKKDYASESLHKINPDTKDNYKDIDFAASVNSSDTIITSGTQFSPEVKELETLKNPIPLLPEQITPLSDKLIGKLDVYTVVRRDTLRLVAAKLGVSRQHLSQMNGLELTSPLRVGQQLQYNNRKIIPQHMKEGIVINIPDRTLYFFKGGKLARSLPVALGKPTKNRKYDWTTPTGKFQITAKQKDPTWNVPASIRSEMEEAGQDILETVPPGPTNPLGKYAIRTSIPNILIHSTSQPASIYSFASHGCIRVYPQHMEDFFYQIRVKTIGEIIYRPVKLAVTENDRIYLEVHQDTYGKTSGLDREAREQIKKLRLNDRVDWGKVEAVVRQKSGIAEDVTLDLLDSPTNRAESIRELSGGA